MVFCTAPALEVALKLFSALPPPLFLMALHPLSLCAALLASCFSKFLGLKQSRGKVTFPCVMASCCETRRGVPPAGTAPHAGGRPCPARRGLGRPSAALPLPSAPGAAPALASEAGRGGSGSRGGACGAGQRGHPPPGRCGAGAAAAAAGPGRAKAERRRERGGSRRRAGHGGPQGGAAEVHLARLHRPRPRPQREGLQVPAQGKWGGPARPGAAGREWWRSPGGAMWGRGPMWV